MNSIRYEEIILRPTRYNGGVLVESGEESILFKPNTDENRTYRVWLVKASWEFGPGLAAPTGGDTFSNPPIIAIEDDNGYPLFHSHFQKARVIGEEETTSLSGIACDNDLIPLEMSTRKVPNGLYLRKKAWGLAGQTAGITPTHTLAIKDPSVKVILKFEEVAQALELGKREAP